MLQTDVGVLVRDYAFRLRDAATGELLWEVESPDSTRSMDGLAVDSALIVASTSDGSLVGVGW